MASVSSHNELLSNVIHAPMSLYDMTRLGRILNLFASEIHVVDDSVPYFMKLLITFYVEIIIFTVVLNCKDYCGLTFFEFLSSFFTVASTNKFFMN